MATEGLVDHLLAVHRPRDCLADLGVHDGALVAAHPELAMRSGLELDDVHVRVVQEHCALIGRDRRAAIGLTAGDGGDLRSRVLDEDELDGVERRRATPPAVVAGVLGTRLDVEAVELPRARTADTRLEVVLDGPRDRRDQRLRVVRGDQVREVTVGLVELEDDGEVVGSRRAALGERAGESRVTGLDQLVHRRDDVSGREGRTVLPLDALAELEGPLRAVVAAGPLGGQLRLDRKVGRRADQVLKDLGADVVGDEVDHGDRVDAFRARKRHGQLDAATLLDGGRRSDLALADTRVGRGRAATGTARTATGGDDRADRRKGETKNRAALNEVAAVDLPLGKRLDQIELGRVRLSAERIQFLEIGHTSSLLRSRCISAVAKTSWLSHTTSVCVNTTRKLYHDVTRLLYRGMTDGQRRFSAPTQPSPSADGDSAGGLSSTSTTRIRAPSTSRTVKRKLLCVMTSPGRAGRPSSPNRNPPIEV